MKRLLLICYYFPPLGGAGVARPLGLVRHLPAHGWTVDVLTIKGVAYRTYEPELLEGIDTSRIYRSGSTDPQRILYMLGVRLVKDHTFERGRSFAERFFPDSKVGWVRPAIKLGRTLIANNNYDMMLSTSPPVSGHMVASQLAKESKIPWVADFRDYWSSHAIEVDYKGEMLTKAKALLNDFTSTATEITSVNSSIQQYFGRGACIHNSVDSSLIKLWQTPKATSQFVIGAVGSVNMYSPVEPLLQLLAAFREYAPEQFPKIRVRYVGAMDPAVLEEQLQKYRLADIFTHYGVRNRRETVQLLNESAVCYVSMPNRQDSVFSTGRIYTMLGSGRPILAAAHPKSEVDRLVTSSPGGGTRFLPEEMSEALPYLKKAVIAHERGEFSKEIPLSERMQYSSEAMAAQFAEVFDRILSGEASESVPSSVHRHSH